MIINYSWRAQKKLLHSSAVVLFIWPSAVIYVHTLWSKYKALKSTLTVKGWSSTLPTSIAALSSNVFVAPVSTWWSFILHRSNHSLIFENNRISEPDPELAGRHFASTRLAIVTNGYIRCPFRNWSQKHDAQRFIPLDECTITTWRTGKTVRMTAIFSVLLLRFRYAHQRKETCAWGASKLILIKHQFWAGCSSTS